MSNDSEVCEFLELLGRFEVENRPVDLSVIALELKCSVDEVDKVLKTALASDLIVGKNGLLRVTEKGHAIVQTHREHYIHKKFRHSLFGRFSELFEGRIKDWRSHWQNRHGFDDTSIEDFYQGLEEVKGRIEETSTLADLRQGEKGIVSFALGGRRLVRRLSEMGLTPGTEVIVIRSAPLHGPIEVKVRGVSLALGRGIASRIFLKGF